VFRCKKKSDFAIALRIWVHLTKIQVINLNTPNLFFKFNIKSWIRKCKCAY